jgi:predicted PurR-regulated permease PerM
MTPARWFLVLVGLLFLWLVRDILPPFLFAAILAFALTPLLEQLETRWHIHRVVLVAGTFILLLVLVGLLAVWLWPILVRESRELTQNLPAILERTFIQLAGSDRLDVLGLELSAHTLAEQLRSTMREVLGTPRDVLHAAALALNGVLMLFVFLVAFFYLLLDGRRIGVYLLRFVAVERQAEVRAVVSEMQRVFGRYMRGQIVLVILMSTVTWLVLSLGFRLRFALPIAIATGFLELIPYLGPLIAGAIATSAGLAQHGGGTAIGIALSYLILRQVEDQLVMPIVVGRAVHLHPLAVIFAVLCGERLAGLVGMLLAIPAAAASSIVLEYWVLRVRR